MTAPTYDPILRPTAAAEYVGHKHPRTLVRLGVERTPIPGTGRTRPLFGYRLSTLNALVAAWADPKARTTARRKVG